MDVLSSISLCCLLAVMLLRPDCVQLSEAVAAESVNK